MRISEAIEAADRQRPNTVTFEDKTRWLYEIEADLAEMMSIEEPPRNRYRETDAKLLMPDGHSDIYVLYLMAMIDNANEETQLYQNDMTVFNAAYLEARQWWWRTHMPPKPRRITGL